MTNYSDVHDIGAKLKEGNLIDASSINLSTAGTTVNGNIVDRRSIGGTLGILAHSVKVLVPFNAAALTTGTTAKIVWSMQDSATTVSGDFVNYEDIDGTSVHTQGMTGDGAEKGIDVADYRLDIAKRFIRVVTETFNESTAGAVNFTVSGVFGVGDEPPAA